MMKKSAATAASSEEENEREDGDELTQPRLENGKKKGRSAAPSSAKQSKGAHKRKITSTKDPLAKKHFKRPRRFSNPV